MARTITVCSLLPAKSDGGYPIALYEVHADHPDGEAYVAGPNPVEVARTAMVQRAISDGALEQVGRKNDDDDDEAPPAPRGRARQSAPAANPDEAPPAPPEA